MTQCNTDQLIAPEVMRYLARRQTELIMDQKAFEMMKVQDDDGIIYSPAELDDLVRETQARRNELALMVTCLEKAETDKRQKDLDAFEDSLNGSPQTMEDVTLSLKREPPRDVKVINKRGDGIYDEYQDV